MFLNEFNKLSDVLMSGESEFHNLGHMGRLQQSCTMSHPQHTPYLLLDRIRIIIHMEVIVI